MQKISAVIITFNEEDDIRDCLESVKWADEIVVVDSFSSDKTVDICKEYTTKIYQKKWQGYVEQRNFAIDNTSNKWILSIDADERLTPGLIKEINESLDNDKGEYDGYYMPRHTYHLGKWINHSGWYPDLKLRLFKKGKGRWAGGKVHEYVEIKGKTRNLKNNILHYSYKSLLDQYKRTKHYAKLMAEDMYSNGKRFSILGLIIVPPLELIKIFFVKLGFLDGIQGFIIAVMWSYYVFLRQVNLLKLSLRQK